MIAKDIYKWFMCLFPMWEGAVLSYSPVNSDTIRMVCSDKNRVFYFTYNGGSSFTLKSMTLKEENQMNRKKG